MGNVYCFLAMCLLLVVTSAAMSVLLDIDNRTTDGIGIVLFSGLMTYFRHLDRSVNASGGSNDE